ncbi:hypothetical protein [Mediterraneibacter glycyrrhizinilyticus]|uniref:hypothetical protein n=1 Tax=Mediterraneibacter glycyrrhizinilyticus TaxID=342942 RepID=UPI0025A447DC|nr:hypothetical protein [Mediterraneibacter glycyrrhizinilyticus]MDM8210294.1 hypothetical protein [Mediterraneibacter glycyrrhizinilyticus]
MAKGYPGVMPATSSNRNGRTEAGRFPFFLLFAGDSGIIAHRITAKEEEFEWITVIFQV